MKETLFWLIVLLSVYPLGTIVHECMHLITLMLEPDAYPKEVHILDTFSLERGMLGCIVVEGKTYLPQAIHEAIAYFVSTFTITIYFFMVIRYKLRAERNERSVLGTSRETP